MTGAPSRTPPSRGRRRVGASTRPIGYGRHGGRMLDETVRVSMRVLCRLSLTGESDRTGRTATRERHTGFLNVITHPLALRTQSRLTRGHETHTQRSACLCTRPGRHCTALRGHPRWRGDPTVCRCHGAYIAYIECGSGCCARGSAPLPSDATAKHSISHAQIGCNVTAVGALPQGNEAAHANASSRVCTHIYYTSSTRGGHRVCEQRARLALDAPSGGRDGHLSVHRHRLRTIPFSSTQLTGSWCTPWWCPWYWAGPSTLHG